MNSEIKENIQGTNSDGKEAGIQINDLEQKEEINIQSEQFEETRIQKNEERLRNLRDNFKHSNIQITGVPEGEEEEQEIENIWKHNEGELPQSGKINRLISACWPAVNLKLVADLTISARTFVANRGL